MTMENQDQEARRTSKKSRWEISLTGSRDSEAPRFELWNIDIGRLPFSNLVIKPNSNWVYPHKMVLDGGAEISLTDFELKYLLEQYVKFAAADGNLVK